VNIEGSEVSNIGNNSFRKYSDMHPKLEVSGPVPPVEEPAVLVE